MNKFAKMFGGLFIALAILNCSKGDNNTKIEKNQTDAIEATSVSTASITSETTDVTTTANSLTTCKVNSSCAVNTSTTNLTTTTTPTTNVTINNKSELHSTEIPPLATKQTSIINGKNICICDLTVDYCDVNCCCDRDCSVEDKLVFSHCTEEFRHYDTRFCDYMQHIYINNTLHEWQVNQNGLFCIVRSNLPPSYIIQKKRPIEKFKDAQFEKVGRYSWRQNNYPSSEVVQFQNHSYTYGAPLWILRNNSTLDHICFIGNNCIRKESVKYLMDVKSTCIHNEINEDSDELKPETYFVNVSVITVPQVFNISLLDKKNVKTTCPRNICSTLQPKFCRDNFENCQAFSKNFTNLRVSCRWSISNQTYSCINLAHKIKYVVFHNGTYGIKKIDLFIAQKNVSFDLDSKNEFSQSFEVDFVWANHSLNYTSHLSGNPGYLAGKPILIGDYVAKRTPLNKSTIIPLSNTTNYDYKFIILRDPFDFTSNFLTLPDNERGSCVLNNNRYLPVEFGYNLYAKCLVDDFFAIQKNYSAKFICENIQMRIFKFWSLNPTNLTLANKLVGQFGNANANNHDQWSRLLFQNDLKDILNYTSGHFDKKHIKCINITTLLVMDIFHTRIDYENILNQEKILATTVQFANFVNMSFPIDLNQKNFSYKVKIGSQVMFYDVTTSKIRKIVDPPTLDIKLPHDFFYPFVKLDNSAAATRNIYLYLSVMCICSSYFTELILA